MAFYGSETEKVRPAFAAVRVERCSKQSHFAVWKLLIFMWDSSSSIMKAFGAVVLVGFVSCVDVWRFKTILLLCKGADNLTGELQVQSSVILRKRNNLYFWLGFSRDKVFLSARF